MVKHRIRKISLATILGLLLGAGEAWSADPMRPRLSSFWDDWTAEVGPLLTERERGALESLEDDATRELFLEGFWRSRGSEALDRWTRNLLEADQFRTRTPWARRAVLMFGKPAAVEVIESCGGLRPLQVWRWDPWHVERQGGSSSTPLYLVLLLENKLLPDSYVPWDPTSAPDLAYYGSNQHTDLEAVLDHSDPQECVSPRLRHSLREAVSFDTLQTAMPWPTPPAAWWDGPADSSPSSSLGRRTAHLEIEFPGTNGRHTVVHGVLRVESARLAELVPGQILDRVTFVGDIYKRGYLVDTFEVVHHVAGSPPGNLLELDLYRGLRPGPYELDLRVADRSGLALLRTRRQLDVPRLTERAPRPAGRLQDYSRLTRSEVVLLDTFPSVEVLPILSKGTSTAEVHALTTGGPIAGVEFRMDGERLMVDKTIPYSLEIELVEDQHEVTVIALDRDSRELVRDSRQLERPGRPFGVQLERPAAGGTMAAVLLDVPQGEELAQLQCFDGRSLVATMTTPPYRCPLPRREVSGLRYLRALATLATGDSAEHLLFFGPNSPDQIQVRLVELFVSVYDADGRPVAELGAEDFGVVDAGRPRSIERIERLADLPISVSVLMDLSSSMGRLAQLAAESAERFFETILIENDLASLLAFNHDLHRLVPFTNEIAELQLGASGLRALGSTRLHDGIVWALGQFAGQENRRALVVLSDGADVDSDFPIEQVLTAAIEAGVVVYPISIARPRETPSVDLEHLAEVTGGRHFVVSSIAGLDAAYRRIEEELRSQYLLVYRLDEESPGFGPRAVEVEVLRPGHTARNVHGYYQ